MHHLSVDIGGTNVRVAQVSKSDGFCLVAEKKTHSIPDLAVFLLQFVNDAISAVIIGVAGIVTEQSHRALNLPWSLHPTELSKKLQKPVSIYNDLELLCYAIPFLSKSDLKPLGLTKEKKYPKAIIALGTGLGMAWCTSDHSTVHPAEMGQSCLLLNAHQELPPTTTSSLKTLESFLSGRGLQNMYYSFAQKEASVHEIIGRSHLPLEHKTITVFIHMIADFCQVIALSGAQSIYLGGGLSLALLPFIDTDSFTRRVRTHPHQIVKNKLENLSLTSITHPQASLFGCLAFETTI